LVEMLPFLSKKIGVEISHLATEIQDTVYNMADKQVVENFFSNVGFRVEKFHNHGAVPPLKKGDITSIKILQEHPIAGPLLAGKSTQEVSNILWEIFNENPHILEPSSNTSVTTFAVKDGKGK